MDLAHALSAYSAIVEVSAIMDVFESGTFVVAIVALDAT
jgi:hypothetical protein